MAGRSATYTFNDVLTLTMFNWWKSGKIADNIFDGLVFLDYLQSHNKKGITEKKGGSVILVPLMYASNTTAGSYRGYDTLDVTPQDSHTNATYDWKQNSVSVSISGLERAGMGGPQEVAPLLAERQEVAEMSLRDEINQQLFSDGTGNSSKDISGIKATCPESAGSTYGGINSSTHTWWENQKISSFGSVASNAATKFNQMYQDVSRSRKSGIPHLILTSPAGYRFYEATLNANERYMITSRSKGGDLGLTTISYKNVPMEYDHDCPQDSGSNEQYYWLNFNYLQLICHKDYKFKPTPFKTSVDQDASVSQIKLYAELACKNRRHQGLAYGASA